MGDSFRTFVHGTCRPLAEFKIASHRPFSEKVRERDTSPAKDSRRVELYVAPVKRALQLGEDVVKLDPLAADGKFPLVARRTQADNRRNQ